METEKQNVEEHKMETEIIIVSMCESSRYRETECVKESVF